MKDNIKLRDEDTKLYLCDPEVENYFCNNIKHSPIIKINKTTGTKLHQNLKYLFSQERQV